MVKNLEGYIKEEPKEELFENIHRLFLNDRRTVDADSLDTKLADLFNKNLQLGSDRKLSVEKACAPVCGYFNVDCTTGNVPVGKFINKFD